MHQPQDPLTSIIIPCYNTEKWIALCVKSALTQTYRNIEVIVVDDGSSDRSIEILKSFRNAIKWVTGPNRGPCTARNIGLQLSHGDWIQYLDADDLLHPQKIELSISASYQFPDAEFVWAPHSSIYEIPPVPAAYNIYSSSDFNINLSKSALDAHYAPATALFKKALLDRVGPWNERLRRWVDLEYHARIAAQTKAYVRIDAPLYFYRQHSGERISNSNEAFSNVDGGLMSLTTAKEALEESSIPVERQKEFLWPFYTLLARSAAENGDTIGFRNLLWESARLRGSKIYAAKCLTAMAASTIIGPRRTAAALKRVLDR